MIEVIGSVFNRATGEGDFARMIRDDAYADALFVFNDNEEQFQAFRRDPASEAGCAAGGGNAAIRPYRCKQPPRAAGIPTGSGGQGYGALTADVKAVIDDAVSAIADLLATGRYRRLLYSASADGSLGTGIFAVNREVKDYIVARLRALGTR
jgi:hypothetical protein